MAKVKIYFNASNGGNADRLVGLFLNDTLVATNDRKELTAKLKAEKAERKANGTKQKLSAYKDIDVKTENVLELRKKGLKGKFLPAKKPITFSATNSSKIIIRVSKRKFIMGLIFGSFNVKIKVKK